MRGAVTLEASLALAEAESYLEAVRRRRACQKCEAGVCKRVAVFDAGEFYFGHECQTCDEVFDAETGELPAGMVALLSARALRLDRHDGVAKPIDKRRDVWHI